ncbi:hypothetical protein AALB_2332 [Agarivorans albus MKT 106]|uniref:Uncharacterized protein n=1 Tax=Agarivorans albus MKT 106 TaxID=1331007 RepID=R9PLL4_AGAAL|nr:hypothetical protein AALB_2332 [Agarivorans albus MKT 106]
MQIFSCIELEIVAGFYTTLLTKAGVISQKLNYLSSLHKVASIFDFSQASKS